MGGELFASVASAYREATGDPHAMSDEQIAGLTKTGYDPLPGVHVSGDQSCPARVRFEVAFDVLGISLSTGRLRAAIVAALEENFQTDHICVSDGQPITGDSEGLETPARGPGGPRMPTVCSADGRVRDGEWTRGV
jgi:hypothetical protein